MNQNWRNRIVEHGEAPARSLVANPANWRTHPPEQQQALAGVLDKVGWVQDVIVNRRTGRIVDGHARVEMAAARNETVPVNYVDLSEAEERLILATFDRVTAMAGMDDAKLAQLLETVHADFPDVDQILAGITDVLEDVARPAVVEGQTDPDAAPELPLAPVSKLGDLWLLGPYVECPHCGAMNDG